MSERISFSISGRSSEALRFSTGPITESERRCLDIPSPEDLARSKYDLPLEYHPKILDEYNRRQPITKRKNLKAMSLEKNTAFAKYTLSQKTSIMFLCESMKPTRNSRFESLNQDALISALESRPTFFAYRQMAIELLRTKTLLQLKILGENEVCPNTSEIPQRVFSWAAEDYFNRRSLNNSVWLEVYERDFQSCMEAHKFKFDLEELAKYFDLIMCGALNDDPNYSFDREVIQPLEDASDLLSAHERLTTELTENRQIFAKLKDQEAAATSKALELEGNVRGNIVQQMADASVLYPILYRYQKSWYTAQADQTEARMDKDLGKHREEIAELINKMQVETSAIQNVLNMYYTEIEYFKNKINEYTAKFEIENDDLENAINYKKLSMTKLELQRTGCFEQMEMFKNALEERKLRKLAEQEERQRLLREKEELKLLKLAKKGTKNQKNADKSKGKDKIKSKSKK